MPDTLPSGQTGQNSPQTEPTNPRHVRIFALNDRTRLFGYRSIPGASSGCGATAIYSATYSHRNAVGLRLTAFWSRQLTSLKRQPADATPARMRGSPPARSRLLRRSGNSATLRQVPAPQHGKEILRISQGRRYPSKLRRGRPAHGATIELEVTRSKRGQA